MSHHWLPAVVRAAIAAPLAGGAVALTHTTDPNVAVLYATAISVAVIVMHALGRYLNAYLNAKADAIAGGQRRNDPPAPPTKPLPPTIPPL